MIHLHRIQHPVRLSFRGIKNSLDYLLCYQRGSYAAYFHEETESSVTVVIYFFKDNLFAKKKKSITVIAKSPAWLVWWNCLPSGSADEMDRKKKCNLGRWDAGRVAQLRCMQLISHLSVLGYFFTSASKKKKKFLKSSDVVFFFFEPLPASLCVIIRVFLHAMLLASSVCVLQQLCVRQSLRCMCGLNSVCVCVRVRDGVGLCVIVRWNGMHVYRAAEQGWVAAACRDDGIGKRSLSLRPTAKSAGDMAAISTFSLSV